MTKPSSTDAQTPPTSVLPDWAVEQPRSALAAMLLIGTWTPSAVADVELLEQFGCSIDQVRELCEVLVNQKPPMMVFHQHRYGTAPDSQPRYAWVDRQAAWWLLAGVLDAKALDRLAQIVVSVLSAAGDDTEEPSEALTNALPHALCQSLALLGHSDGIVICEPAPSTRAAELVTALLGSKTAPLQLPLRSRLASQADLLPLLAEAAPDAFLTALATAVAKPSSDKLQESDVRPLCRALETLAWDTDLLERAVTLLAELTRWVKVPPKNIRTVAPLQSLHQVFSPNLKQTCAPIDERLAVLQKLCEKVPDVAWSLLLSLLETGQGMFSLNPARKPWVSGLSFPPALGLEYQGEGYVQVETFLTLACQKAGTSGERWAALVEKLPHLPHELAKSLLLSLESTAANLTDPDCKVWAALDRRRALYQYELQHDRDSRNQKARPLTAGEQGEESTLASKPDPVEVLHQLVVQLVTQLAPQDLVKKLSWLFEPGAASRLDFPSSSFEKLLAAQQDALRQIHGQPDCWQLLVQLAANLQDPSSLADALVDSPLAETVAERMLSADTFSPLENVVPRFLAQWPRDSFGEQEKLIRGLLAAGRSEDAAQVISHMGSLNHEVQLWDLLDTLGEPLLGVYWGRLYRFFINEQRSPMQQQRVVRHLLKYRNLEVALLAASEATPPLPNELIFDVVQQLTDFAKGPSKFEHPLVEQVGGHYLGKLFSQISPTSQEELQRAYLLELAWAEQLSHNKRRLRFVPTHLTEHPEDFAKLIRHAVTPCLQFVDRYAVMAVLDVWKEFPGSDLPAAAAEDFLLDWSRSVLSHFAEPDTSTNERSFALNQLAELLIRPQGSNGLWLCIAARKLLEEVPELARYLATAKRNARGAHYRDPEGGVQERKLARQFAEAAAQLAEQEQWPTNEKLSLSLADHYESAAKHEDEEAVAWSLEVTPKKLAIRPLFPLTQVRISNFRGIKELSLEPHPRLTLLFGKNASGKSSLLDAIAVGLSFLGPSLPRLEESDPKWHRFAPKDMRRTFLEDGTPVLEKQQEVQLWGQPQGEYPQPLHWQTGDRISGRGPQIIDRLGPGLEAYLAQVTEALRTSDDKVLMPVFVHYGVERAVSSAAQDFVRPPEGQLIPRMAGLKGALVSTARFDWAVSQLWVMESIESAEQKKRRNFDYRWPRLEAVREAIKANLKTPDAAGARCENPRVAPEKRKLVVDYFTADGRKQELEIGQLSDGFRTHLALVMDLALRMVICNPPPEEAGTDIPDGYGTRSYAVVLLDEIDLHLHPSWQHIVLRGLLDAFPNAQFFVTTHSEQVLSSVNSTKEALVLMVGQEEGAVQLWSPPLKPFGARSQDILAVDMDTPERPPDLPIIRSLKEYMQLVNSGRGQSERALHLRAELGELDPLDASLVDADVALDRQKRLAKQGS